MDLVSVVIRRYSYAAQNDSTSLPWQLHDTEDSNLVKVRCSTFFHIVKTSSYLLQQ